MGKKELIRQISSLLSSLSPKEKSSVLNAVIEEWQRGIPISAFKAKLSCFEIIVKYLKEVTKKSFKEISKILNRKLSTIYNTYRKSRIKFSKSLDIRDDSIIVPFSIFRQRKYSVLETVVYYLKHEHNLSLNQISKLLHKNYNTVKTVYRRYNLKKNG